MKDFNFVQVLYNILKKIQKGLNIIYDICDDREAISRYLEAVSKKSPDLLARCIIYDKQSALLGGWRRRAY